MTSDTRHNGYLLCNGASYDTGKYANLYSVIGASSVPDLRGLFLRGLDTAGQYDNFASRTLFSYGEGTYIAFDQSTNSSTVNNIANGNGVTSSTAPTALQKVNADTPLPSASVSCVFNNDGEGQEPANVTGSNSVLGVARPKNSAVNYIIKAQ